MNSNNSLDETSSGATKLTQPFILTGSINRVPTCLVRVKAVTSVGWQITLCDPIDKWRFVVLRWISRRTIYTPLPLPLSIGDAVRTTTATVQCAVYCHASVNLCLSQTWFDDPDEEQIIEHNLFLRSVKSEAEVTSYNYMFIKHGHLWLPCLDKLRDRMRVR